MKFHVFLSHNSKDKPVVELIAHKLEAKGLKVWLDKWNLVPGEPWQEDLEEALDNSQTIAVFVGPHRISPWENEEMRSAIEERVQDKKRRVIPVLLPGAPDNKSLTLPRFLKRLTWVDLRGGLNDEDAIYRLECGIKGISPGKSTKKETAIPSTSGELPPVGDLPIGSYIPFPPNPLFEGRVNDLKKLAEALCSPLLSGEGPGERSGMVVNQKAITGMGGLGKTQLAVEFAYRYGSYFRGVHWLNLADPSQLDSEIAKCGSQMGLADWNPNDQPSQVTLTLNTWKSDGPRLLVLDNFEDVERVNSVLPRLRHSNLRLLVTSRRTDWPSASGLSPLALDVFSKEESLEFLKKSLEKQKDADEDLAKLSERLGYLPLALELASRYLNAHPRLSVDEYLSQAKDAFEHKSLRGWREDLPAPTQHDLDLQHTFALSWDVITDETTKNLFLTAGYLAPNSSIPPVIFEKTMDIPSDACDEALGVLYGLGLLRQSEDNLPTIHPLLAEYARGLAREKVDVLENLVIVLGKISSDANQTGLPHRFVPFRLHIPVTASHAAQAGMEGSGLLWNEYGYHLKMIADHAGAKAAYERALKIFEKQLGEEHPNVATLVNNLGSVLKALGDHAGAKAAYERALKIDEATYGPDHPSVAIRVNNLGGVLQALGDHAGAKAAYERALKIDEATYGPDHPSVAIRVNNLGFVLKALGDHAGAKAAYERALKIDEATYGPDHPSVAIRVNNLGGVLQDLGDHAGAKTAYERALKIDEATYGPDHPAVARDVNNLGNVLQDLGDHAGAKAAYERALKIDEATYGPDHPDVAIDVNNLGSVLQDLGDHAGAKAAYERALKIDEATYGPDHPDVAKDVNNLGGVLQDLGDHAGAKAAYERALKIDEATYGPDHPDVALSLWWLGVIARDDGNRELAKDYFERALAIFKKFLPRDHPNIKGVQGNLDSLGDS